MKQSVFHWVCHPLLERPITRWFVILGTIVYLLSPIDLLPDMLVGGIIDDGVLVALLTTGLTRMMLERRRKLKAQRAEDRETSSE